MSAEKRPVDLGDRILLLGTAKGIEPPISVYKCDNFHGESNIEILKIIHSKIHSNFKEKGRIL